MLVWVAVSAGLMRYLIVTHIHLYVVIVQSMLAVLLWVFWTKRKFAWYVPIPLLIGTVLLILLSGSKDQSAILVIQVGALLIFLGISVLSQYLREHPVPQA